MNTDTDTMTLEDRLLPRQLSGFDRLKGRAMHEHTITATFTVLASDREDALAQLTALQAELSDEFDHGASAILLDTIDQKEDQCATTSTHDAARGVEGTDR